MDISLLIILGDLQGQFYISMVIISLYFLRCKR